MRCTIACCGLLVASIAGLSSIVGVSGQRPAPTTLEGPLRSHLDSEQLGIVTSIRGLPLGVRDQLQTLFGSYTLEIAEPGEPFQVGDVIGDRPLPIRRLIAAGCSTDHCLVHYERGGIAHTWHVALFHWTPTATRLEWGGVAPRGFPSIGELRNAVLAGLIRGPVATW